MTKKCMQNLVSIPISICRQYTSISPTFKQIQSWHVCIFVLVYNHKIQNFAKKKKKVALLRKNKKTKKSKKKSKYPNLFEIVLWMALNLIHTNPSKRNQHMHWHRCIVWLLVAHLCVCVCVFFGVCLLVSFFDTYK